MILSQVVFPWFGGVVLLDSVLPCQRRPKSDPLATGEN
jgi:hypothetical protein